MFIAQDGLQTGRFGTETHQASLGSNNTQVLGCHAHFFLQASQHILSIKRNMYSVYPGLEKASLTSTYVAFTFVLILSVVIWRPHSEIPCSHVQPRWALASLVHHGGKLLCSVGRRADLDCCEPKPKSAHEVA